MNVGSVDVFGCYEAESAVAVGLRGWFEGGRGVEFGFPDHVADAVADEEEELDDVGCEGGGVEG